MWKQTYIFRDLACLDTSNWIKWKYLAFPSLEYHMLSDVVLQHLLGKFTVKNDTYCGSRHIYVGLKHMCTHLIGFHGNIPRWGIK